MKAIFAVPGGAVEGSRRARPRAVRLGIIRAGIRTQGDLAMKYVLLGTLAAGAMRKQATRTASARGKLRELGIKLESVHYTQGSYDFVDIVEAPSAEAMLAFSVWYAEQGYGKLTSLPAFDERTMVKALQRGGLRGRAKRLRAR